MLSKHEVLMADPGEHRPILVNYDRRTGRHKLLGTVPESVARYHRIENVTVSDSQIAWIAAVRHPDRTSPELQLWTMPITGGQIRVGGAGGSEWAACPLLSGRPLSRPPPTGPRAEMVICTAWRSWATRSSGGTTGEAPPTASPSPAELRP
ncbi:hypothetical protein [Nonomuraea sp. NPDC049646]|uniref:hypothetical protein n=1 Tax=unclassified Nonomuraea TaxID=2593643 RepID=UPI003791A584